jgi:hypothetical protein
MQNGRIMAKLLARMVALFPASLRSPIDFFNSRSSISQKNDMPKRMGPFDIRKVPKSQNMEKQENLL